MHSSLTILLLAVNVVAYFLFKGGASLRNKAAKRNVLAPRVVGCIGVVVVAVCEAWYARTHLVNEQLLASLPPFKQGEYIGQVVGLPLFPALLVLATVGIRGWLAGRRARTSAGA